MVDQNREHSQSGDALLLRELEASRFVHGQIALLKNRSDFDSAMEEVLCHIGKYLCAERASLFVRDADGSMHCACQWCAEGISTASEPSPALKTLRQDNCVLIPDVHEICASDPALFEALSLRGVRSVIEAPIVIDGRFIGYIGIYNAPSEQTRISADSLGILGAFIGTILVHQKERKRISDSHNMQREIVSAINYGIVAFTVPDCRILTVNQEACRILGCTHSDDVMGALRHFMDKCISDEDRALIDFSKLKEPGDAIFHVYSAHTEAGLIHIKSGIKMLRFDNGQRYLLFSLLDITEQYNLSNSLETERKNYRDALATGSEFTFFFDVNEGLIHEEFLTAHNVNLIRNLGFSTPVSFDELMSAYLETDHIQFLRNDMAGYFTCSGLLDAFERGITSAETEYHNPVNDLYIRTNCLMSRDRLTGHVHASVVANDITASRKEEIAQREALKEANAKLEKLNDEMSLRLDAIVNGISGGLKIAENTQLLPYTYISEGAAALQGYTVPEFMEKYGGSIISNVYPGEGEDALSEAMRQVAEKGVYSVKYRVPHKDGSIRWVIDRGKLVTDHVTGKQYYYILMQDITELQERNFQLNNALSMQKEIASSLGSGILAYTIPERKILLVNRETERMFACKGQQGEHLTVDLMGHVVPEDRPRMTSTTSCLVNPGDRVEYSFHYRNDDGSLSNYHCNTALLSFDNGQKYILSSINDMTDIELMEKRIAAERIQYRNALAFGSAAFVTIDLIDGYLHNHIISRDGVNLTANLGLTMPVSYEELMKAWFDSERVLSDSPQIDTIRSKQALLECCRGNTSVIDFEYHVPAENKYFHVMVLPANIDNHPHASFILYDISSDRAEEQQRRTVIESLGKIYSGLYHLSLRDEEYVAYKQHDDIISELPEKGELSRLREVYTGKYVLPEFREPVESFLRPEVIRNNLAKTDYSLIEYRRKSLGWCRITLVAAGRDENEAVTSVVLAVNVIENQKQLELSRQEALKVAYDAANMASSAKTEFLANMSHDIRTPMNAIIGMTAIAGTHLDDRERVVDCLSKITVASKHLLGLINEVLDMSKIESGKMELHEEAFVLPELIDNLLSMSRSGINAKNHTLNVSIRNIEHEQVIGDSQRIQQVFMNIMSNAIKYTPDHGRIQLSISEKPTNRRKIGCYEFIFEDNGIGMSEEYLEHLFEPFVRARDDARISSIQGTGLGMPITRNIIQMMNGDIQVTSKLNQGTRVTITFFLKLQGEGDSLDCSRFTGLPVLVADDDDTSREYACQLLGEIGMESEGVSSGEEAVQLTLNRHQNGEGFFAVILDWKMPGMDGVEATRQIRRSVGSDVPIIVISAYDWSDIEPAARAAGVTSFISKPLFKSRMVHMFNELVGNKKTEPHDAAIEALSHQDFAGKRVLLVEDNELNAEIATEIFGMAGLDVTLAENGKAAVDVMSSARDNEFDIVFMDIQMPIMNGYEATRAIRALPGYYPKTVPIIAMTANAFAEDVAASKSAGMNEHMAKPIDFERLLVILRRWLH